MNTPATLPYVDTNSVELGAALYKTARYCMEVRQCLLKIQFVWMHILDYIDDIMPEGRICQNDKIDFFGLLLQ